MRFPLSRVLACVVGVVTVLPLVFSAVMVVSVPIVAGEGKSFLTLKDVNNDGRMDIVTPSGEVYFNVGGNRYRSNEIVFTGAGFALKEYSFVNDTLAPYVGPVSEMEPSPFSFLDYDGDGIPETIIITDFGDYSMTLLRNDGTGTFTPVKTMDVQADPSPEYIAVFDDRELKKKQGNVVLL